MDAMDAEPAGMESVFLNLHVSIMMKLLPSSYTAQFPRDMRLNRSILEQPSEASQGENNANNANNERAPPVNMNINIKDPLLPTVVEYVLLILGIFCFCVLLLLHVLLVAKQQSSEAVVGAAGLDSAAAACYVKSWKDLERNGEFYAKSGLFNDEVSGNCL